MNLPFTADGQPWGCATVTNTGEVTFEPQDTVWLQVHRDVIEEAAERLRAIAQVRDLHQGEPLMDFEWCDRCDSQWPCDTIRALDGEQE